MASKKLEFDFEKQILLDVEEQLIRRRFHYILDIQKQHRDDIETLYKYVKYVTIYAITLNVIIVGILLCLIIMN